MLFSPQDERKLVMLENSLNFKFKRIGTPGAKEIAEASAVVAAKRWGLLIDSLVNVPYSINEIAYVEWMPHLGLWVRQPHPLSFPFPTQLSDSMP